VVGRLTIILLQISAEFVLKEFLKSLNIWQRYGEKLIASSALCIEALSW